ncbi:hypothetical protein AJ80_05826 [Polytolypa hystricis UAMH7299]|uniref:BZIP domain-containing protein n=1 Tax=Polytolypa hystricis (strain UAMH7299) TaxID=1447883 RepID=A0A2B7XZK2_POLH7|nr:hypothetical protein AJ80_05826 [Polytolypa hystricis UAMH7299]
MASLGPGASVMDMGARNGQSTIPNTQSDHGPSKSPSLLSMSFLKNFSSTPKKTTRDGQQPKRRGPKPDSKPAQTRRQELNRQAQRTHRERKEQYIRTLETEISRLRENYSTDVTGANVSLQQQREALQEQREENAVLREILAAHGIPFEAELERRKAALRATGGNNHHHHQQQQHASSSLAASTPQSHTHSQTHSVGMSSGPAPLLTTPPTTVSVTSPSSRSDSADNTQHNHHHNNNNGSLAPYHAPPIQQQYEQPGALDGQVRYCGDDQLAVSSMPGVFEKDPQLGIDFILTLESTCRSHMEMLCRRSLDDETEETVCGHVLMASCPPPTEISATPRGQAYPSKTYALPPANLNTLLNLSRQLVTDGQITPIMALQFLKNHDMYQQLTTSDVRHMIDDLNGKIRCYGFGAVIEDFEFMDSLSSVLATKLDLSVDDALDLRDSARPARAEEMMYY